MTARGPGAGAALLLAAVCVAGAHPDGARAQEPAGAPGEGAAALEARAAVGADTIRVGDVVAVAVRVSVGPDREVAWPDTLPLAGTEVENAARVRERVDTLDDGRLQHTAVYAVTPWRTGELALPPVPVRVGGDGEAVAATVPLPALQVASVLPADTAGIEPRPARGVIGASWALWPILLLLLLLAALVVAGIVWLRHRRPDAVPAEPGVSPRELALARIDRARNDGLIERGAMKELYTRTSEAVRDYVAALEGDWGEDLTTTELLGRLGARAGAPAAAALAEVLGPADQVKFARRRPDRDAALADWEAARAWVADFDWPPEPVGDHEEAAA